MIKITAKNLKPSTLSPETWNTKCPFCDGLITISFKQYGWMGPEDRDYFIQQQCEHLTLIDKDAKRVSFFLKYNGLRQLQEVNNE